MKPVTPRLHGVLDYGSCALMLAAPHLLKLGPTARKVSYALAGSYLLVTALTDFPLGLRREIPFPVHGKIELSTIPALLLTASLQDGRERAYFLALASTVAGAYALTDWEANPDA